jgi:hypothetical protein
MRFSQARKRVKRTVASAFTLFALVVGMVGASPLASAENEYTCGTYGAGNYGQGCVNETAPSDGSSGGGSSTGGGAVVGSSEPTTRPTDQGTPETPSEAGGKEILLNDFASYAGASGKAVSLKAGQTIAFVVDGTRYTVTVKEVTSGAIVISVTSGLKDVTIDLGKTVNYDANGDGKALHIQRKTAK